MGRSFTHCRECETAFLLVTKSSSGLKRRQCFVLFSLLGNFMLGFLLIQIWLCLVALLCRLADPSLRLVQVFNFKQSEATSTEGTSPGAMWDTLQHHKTTYYTSAILVTLILLGAATFIWTCRFACRSQSGQRPDAGCPACDCCNDCFHIWYYTTWLRMTDPSSYGSYGNYGNVSGVDGVDCSCCCNSAQSDDFGSGLAALAIIAVAAFVFFLVLGVFFLLAMLVGMLVRVVQRLIQVQQMKALAEEYEVQDLSSGQPFAFEDSAVPRLYGEISVETSKVRLEPVADHQLQRSLARDLHAILG